jgi:hypothetical protein
MDITNIKEGYKNLSFVLTERYTTAADMYKLMLKLNTEQETSGDFDVLNSNIHDTLSQYDLMFHLNPQFFTGREDMIFELNVDIVMNNDCKLDNKDLVKEHILGTVLKEIQNHFDVYYRRHNDSNIAVVKHHFRNY